jgi:hypothetical protein
VSDNGEDSHKVQIEEVQLGASIIPIELLQRLADYVGSKTGGQVEYVSVVYKTLDRDPCSVTLRSGLHDREIEPKKQSGPRRRKDADAAKRGSTESTGGAPGDA